METRKEELIKIDEAIDHIMASNLDDNIKKFLMRQLNRRVYEIRTEMAIISRDMETYKAR